MNDLTTMKTQNAAPITTGGGKGLMGDMLRNPALFEHVCRMAKVYANSPLFPEHLRKGGNETAIANAILVMNIASRLNEDELTVAQNIFFVGGKPGWSASYMISKANQHGVFRNPIDWDITGKGDTLSITAYGNLKSTNKRVEVTMSMETAKKEGWTKNAKYQSIPEVMLRYRSATALIRLYCPEVMIGIPSDVEIETEGRSEMRDVTPQSDPLSTITGADDDKPAKAAKATAAPAADAETYDPETGEVTDPKPAKVNRTKPAPAEVKKADPEPEPETVEDETAKEPEKVEAKKEAAPAEDAAPVDDEPNWGKPGISQGGDERPEPSAPSHKAANLRKSILNDLKEIGEADAVESFYAKQLDELKAEAPDVFAELQEAFAESRKNEA